MSNQSDAHAQANVACINECHKILTEAGFDEAKNDHLAERVLDVTQRYGVLFARADDLRREVQRLTERVKELEAKP
jgi:Spy/CpxP family protein refolding chaperone